MVNTLRILVSWKCNLNCSYCCNEQAQFRKDIHPVKLDDIQFDNYNIFCISGGEPLLNLPRVREVCERILPEKLIILYTNGTLLKTEMQADILYGLGIKAINVGLHNPDTFDALIKQVTDATKYAGLSVRFHAQDIYEADLTARYPNISFRFWKMDDCERNNEDRVVLI